MYHKVFINSVELAFGKTMPEGFLDQGRWPKGKDLQEWMDALREVQTPQKIFIHDAVGSRWRAFVKQHKPIAAAGGLVVNTSGELLVIHRLGVWDLPKGKIDDGETPPQAALREIDEECGITGLEIVEELPNTWHTYPHKGKNVLKQTYWFYVRYTGNQPPVPQHEENIIEVKFMLPAEVAEAVKNTYESLKPLFQTYLLRHK